MDVTAIFDIGKTNKKFFLFDAQFREVHRAYTRFEETKDDDGDACDDLQQLTAWMKATFAEALADQRFNIRWLNFSTYGASLVHIDRNGQPVTPLYNYLKRLPEDLMERFMEQYGPSENWQAQTASPLMGMLNSGLQLYWLKHHKPEQFAKVHRSLHFPQFCAYLFTGKVQTEYTSIGCHTGLWHYKEGDYHPWVYAEDLDRKMPALCPTTTATPVHFGEQEVMVGVGIHDSSAALLPYILANKEPFLLLSTGTWSIALNPFSAAPLTKTDLANDCLNFLRVDGMPVRAARLFLGNEYKIWARKLAEYYGKPYETHRNVAFDTGIHQQLQSITEPVFQWESIRRPGETAQGAAETRLSRFGSYEAAYHQLMRELAQAQCQSLKRAQGQSDIRKLYIDGGFVDNAIFLRYLAEALPGYSITTTESPLGSALGAAMAIHNRVVDPEFILDHFSPQLQKPITT
ncbi:MAG: FGGY family carbohydrate kinase [Phaeodactylibacter sp.]|uniref:FGGY-family carbohydrate kinase n=1 Tax=Phaeodactylibacter sp. TaxID=1940289 RepID=UPI0032EDA43F